MKSKIIRLLLSYLIIGIQLSFAQPIINWGEEIIVANGATYGTIRPRITLNNNNNPVIVFGQNPGGVIRVANWNGSNFDTPIPILPASMETYLAVWTGPDIASKGDTIGIAFKANPLDTGNIYAVMSYDGGLTFSDTIRVDNHDSGMAWMPSIDLTEIGNPLVTYMAHDGQSANPRYVYVNSSDAGTTFNPEQEITSIVPGEACDCCPSQIVAGGNNQALLFRNNDNNIRDIYTVYSNDSGLTFNQSENVDQLNWSIMGCPTTGPDGHFIYDDLYTVYASKKSGQFRVYTSKTTSSPSLTFIERTPMTPPSLAFGKQNYPRIDGDNQVMVAVWAEADPSDFEIYSAVSTNGNANEFTITKQKVNTSSAGMQNYPDIAYSNGEFHVVYEDVNLNAVIYKKGTLSSVGLNPEEVSTVKIYPNPVISDKHIILEGDQLDGASIELYNSTGQRFNARTSYSNSQLYINLEGMASGTYYLKVNNKEYSIIIK